MVLISHRNCSEKIAVELARHATPSPRTCKEQKPHASRDAPNVAARGSMVFHKVVQALDRAQVEARPAAGLFDKPTESSMIATWSGAAWHVLRSIGMHFSLT